MSYTADLIAQVKNLECPACGQDKINVQDDPDGSTQTYCNCCGRLYTIVSNEHLSMGIVDDWDFIEHQCSHKFPKPPIDPNYIAPDEETIKKQKHFISLNCEDEICFLCWEGAGTRVDAAHKVGEEIPNDEPTESVMVGDQTLQVVRHNFTSYVCCGHFKAVFGGAVFCP